MKKLLEILRSILRRNRVRMVVTGVLLTLLLAFLWPDIIISVRPGELGVLYSRFFGGTVLNRTYDEGVHFIQPWDILYIYDVRIQETTQEVDVLTVDGLTVKVQVSLRYQIMRDRLPSLHQQIGPEYRDKIILPIMTSAVRQTIGSYRPDALYSTARQELQDKMLVDAVEEMGRIPVLIHGFVVKSITLPDVLSNAISEKLVAEQKYLRYNYLILEAKEEAKRKAIEGQGIRFYQSLVNSHMTDNYLRYEGIQATTKLAASQNAKIVVVGSGKGGLPLILNTQDTPSGSGGNSIESSAADNAGDTTDMVQASGSKSVPTSRSVSGPSSGPGNGSAAGAAGSTMPQANATQADAAAGAGWKMTDTEFLDFVKRLDMILLNPRKVTTEKQ